MTCAPLREAAEQPPQGSSRQRPLSRGCGGRAFARVDGEEEGPTFPRVAARPAGCSALHLAGLLISFPIHQRMALLCVDPLSRSHSAGFLVRLYW
jgi:hypothetical protein